MFKKTLANLFVSIQHYGVKPILSELKKTEFYNDNLIKDYQSKKLQKLVLHAYNNVPFYYDLFNRYKVKPENIRSVDDLKKLPILEKETIQSNYSRLLATNVSRTYTRKTSGSTGAPLKITYDKQNKLIEIALMLQFLSNIGKEIGSTEINLWGRPGNSINERILRYIKGFIYNKKLKDVYQFNDQDFSDLARELSNSPNIHLRGFTQAIYLLACKLRDNNNPINIDAVSVTAEKLFEHQRILIGKYLTKNLYDQYGCGEVNSIAFECNIHNGLHHSFQHSVLEILDKSGEITNDSGDVVVTNLDNYAMPLIRYRNGDIIKLSHKSCSCGRSGKLIKSIEGRLYDFIEGANGEIIHSAFLDHILVESSLMDEYNIQEIRIIQTSIDEIVVQYVAKKEIPENCFRDFQEKLIYRLGSLNIIYEKKLHINETTNGKRRFVVPLNEFLKNPSVYDVKKYPH
jgi:phenylacetate-CoA ligase